MEWIPGEPFHWDVGAMEAPPTTPQYVFEPRPTQRILEDLDAATDPAAIARLEAEQRLCDRPHVVYAAFYGTLPKVGMTSVARLPERLREQGADAGFAIATTEDRATARDVENAVSFRFGLPQWRTHKELLPQWTRPVELERVHERADDLRRRLSVTYQPQDLIVIDDHPMPVLPARPHRIEPSGTHQGIMVGAKGTHIVYEAAGAAGRPRLDVGRPRLVAVRHTDLEGRRVTIRPVSDDGP